MTHYKKQWMQLGLSRLKEGKRFIIDSHILVEFLCFCNKNSSEEFNVKVRPNGVKSIITVKKQTNEPLSNKHI